MADLRGADAAPPGPDRGWRIASGFGSADKLMIMMHHISPGAQEELVVEIKCTVARGSREHHPSARVEADLMSTTGVSSNASIGPIFKRVPSISRTVTGCSPSGFGRAGERV